MTFAEHVRVAFKFLEAEGFCPETIGAREVRYLSSRVRIDVEYQPRDGGVNVDFGRTDRDESLSFLTFLSTVDRPLAKQLGQVIEREADAPASAVALAQALAQYGRPITAADGPTFDRMATTLAPMPWE